MNDVFEIKELVNLFAILADVKDAKNQGELFLEEGVLEFQQGFNDDVKNIVGRESIVTAFKRTIEPCVSLFHLNGQHVMEVNGDEATGTAYCQATLVNDVEGKQMVTVNNVRYSDIYAKVNGKWYIKKRRTTFLISDTHELNH